MRVVRKLLRFAFKSTFFSLEVFHICDCLTARAQEVYFGSAVLQGETCEWDGSDSNEFESAQSGFQGKPLDRCYNPAEILIGISRRFSH